MLRGLVAGTHRGEIIIDVEICPLFRLKRGHFLDIYPVTVALRRVFKQICPGEQHLELRRACLGVSRGKCRSFWSDSSVQMRSKSRLRWVPARGQNMPKNGVFSPKTAVFTSKQGVFPRIGAKSILVLQRQGPKPSFCPFLPKNGCFFTFFTFFGVFCPKTGLFSSPRWVPVTALDHENVVQIRDILETFRPLRGSNDTENPHNATVTGFSDTFWTPLKKKIYFLEGRNHHFFEFPGGYR